MDHEYFKNIKPVLDTFDKIREILRFDEIELPKIVVVGDQSSGKSSVLESITGISLPRGENTVTRCPIVLQMRNVESISDEYATVRIEGEKNDDKIQIKELCSKIELTQKELINKCNVEITDIPIYVNVKKVSAPDLTLYDLPGITYKKEELTIKIKEIYSKFSAGKETLILLVLPANTDFTTSEAISIIRRNTDYKVRTLAIITKIDLAANTEKNLFQKIMFNELDLKFNPIVVRNRTQDELDLNEDFDSIRKKERELINKTSDLSKLPIECKGTEQLITKLIEMQKEKLISSKYDIREKISDKLNTLREEIKGMPSPAETITEKVDRFRECLTHLTHRFSNLVNGTELNDDNNLHIGSRIRDKFEVFFKTFRDNNKRFFSDDFSKEIKSIITESRALRLPNFPQSSAFHLIMSKEINNVRKSVEYLIDQCKEYIKEILINLCSKAFSFYPEMKKALLLELKNSVEDQTDSIKLLVNELLNCELEGEWTVNPYYLDVISKIKLELDKGNNMKECNNALTYVPLNTVKQIINTERNESTIFDIKNENIMNLTKSDPEIQNIQISCFAYWLLFEKRFIDYLQLIILRKLVYYYVKDMSLMLEKKYSPSLNNHHYISEDLSISRRRHEITSTIKRLDEARDELNNIL